MLDDDSEDRPSLMPPERPLTITAAILWFIAATVGAMLLILVTHSVRPSSETDIVNAVACQAVAYFAAILLAVRVHAGNRTLPDVFALRKTHPAFHLLGALLGVCLQVPAELLQRLMFHFQPMAPEVLQLQTEMMRMDSTVARIMIPLAVVGLGPLVEELFFRGVLFGGMRRGNGAAISAFIVSVLFAGAHGSSQLFIPLLIVGGVITFLRAASGSLWPCLIAHMTFNAIPVLGMASGWLRLEVDPEPFPLILSVGGVSASVLIIAALVALSRRSEAAHRARQEDSS
jgi:hypothetical protein